MVYFHMYGRLGNLLFQYAAALTAGQGEAVGITDNPKTLAVVRKVPWIFGRLRIVDRPPAGAVEIRQRTPFDPVDFHSDSSGDRLLHGFFQRADFFDEELVRRAYAMPAEMEAKLRARYGEVLARPGVTSIHVRRGDYLDLPQCHPFAGERYFRAAVGRLPEVRDFIVCSDDLPWCREFFPKAFPERRFVFSQATDPMEDVYLCSLCGNHIMSNSSFSWWGAYLDPHPDKRVIAPSMWFGYALKRTMDWTPIYFRGTEIIPNRYTPGGWLRAHWIDFQCRRRERARLRQSHQTAQPTEPRQ